MEIHKPEVILLAVTPASEKLIEEAGRTCYLSLSKMTDESEKNFIRSAIRRGHHSILEHASASFRILGASRAFTHQLVRHRIASYSQQSQRYVDEAEFNFIVPDDINASEKALAVYREHIEYTRQAYIKLRELGIKKEDARFLLPNALESQIVFSANFRELRAVFNLRLDKSAQWEIRRVCMLMLKIMQEQAPSVFGDYVINEADCTAHSNIA